MLHAASVGLWVELTDRTREWLSEAEVTAVCDALWASEEKGAVSIVGKISYERERPSALQRSVHLSEGERHAFRSALDRARRL